MAISPSDLHIRAIAHTDLGAVAELLGRGMADNPMHVAVYRRDEASRASLHGRLMLTRLRTAPWLQMEGVNQGDVLVGVTAWAPPGTCRPPLRAQLQLMGRAVTFGARTASRLLAWKRGMGRP